MRSGRRLLALAAFAARRLAGRMRRGDRARVALSVFGVALAIGFMVTVTGVSVGLTTQTTVYGSGVDYWVTPASSSSSTMAVSVGGPEFGAVHDTTARISGIDGVEYATPVKTELVRLTHGNESAYVLLLGVVPEPGRTVGGLPLSPLTPGDPHYANGSYDGPWTGDLVLSEAAATLLNATPGARLAPASAPANRTFAVTNVSSAAIESGAGPIPVGVVHLAELQSLTRSTAQDSADRFLVQTDDPGVAGALADVYPHSRVVAQSGVGTGDVTSSKLALAIAVTAFIVALCVGGLFVTTALGLELTADRAQYATLTAIGVSTRSQSAVVVTQTLLVTLAGGVLGVLAGYGGILLTNRVAARYVGAQVAAPAPAIALYGLAVALAIGLVSSPYLVWLTHRTDPLTVLD